MATRKSKDQRNLIPHPTTLADVETQPVSIFAPSTWQEDNAQDLDLGSWQIAAGCVAVYRHLHSLDPEHPVVIIEAPRGPSPTGPTRCSSRYPNTSR